MEGTLRVERSHGVVNHYELLGLTVTKAAPPGLAPNISKKQAIVREQPRRLEIGDPVPDFTMTSQDGKAVKLSDLRGNVVVLTFIYTRCPLPDFCPLMDKKFSELAQRLGAFPRRASKIRLISLSFDPEHDTPELLRKHAQVRGATPPFWSYAVASHAELAKIGDSAGALLPARRHRNRPQPLHGDHRSRRETGPAGGRHGTQQMDERRSVRRQFIHCSPPRKSEPEAATSRSVDLCRRVL